MTEDAYVLEEFYKIITPNKVNMFERIAPQRSKHIVVGLENIQQDHNASAIMRTMDCLGFQELHLIEKNNNYQFQRDIALGAARWLDVMQHQQEPEPVLQHFQHAIAADFKSVFGMFLQDLEHHLALPHGGRVLDLPLLGHGQKVGRGLGLQIGKIQTFNVHRIILETSRTAVRRSISVSGGIAMAGRPAQSALQRPSEKVNQSEFHDD